MNDLNTPESVSKPGGQATAPLSAIKVIVLCTNSQGVPEFHACVVRASQEQVAEGEHYDLAKQCAESEGYEHPMIAFDGGDTAAKQLGEMLAWI